MDHWGTSHRQAIGINSCSLASGRAFGAGAWSRAQVFRQRVTVGYPHGHALDLKRELLCKWADHVQGLVSLEGAALLR